ncbi:unnamed protein product, partial [Musa textilis]
CERCLTPLLLKITGGGRWLREGVTSPNASIWNSVIAGKHEPAETSGSNSEWRRTNWIQAEVRDGELKPKRWRRGRGRGHPKPSKSHSIGRPIPKTEATAPLPRCCCPGSSNRYRTCGNWKFWWPSRRERDRERGFLDPTAVPQLFDGRPGEHLLSLLLSSDADSFLTPFFFFSSSRSFLFIWFLVILRQNWSGFMVRAFLCLI